MSYIDIDITTDSSSYQSQSRKFTVLKKVVIIVPYFGSWPEWFPLYLESCRYNATINWLFYTDCPIPNYMGSNIRFVSISFADYIQMVEDVLHISLRKKFPFKLCDIRPAYGFIHKQDIQGYDYFGFGDIDVIYGDIRKFFDDRVLSHNVISTLPDRISGHLTLFKNCDLLIHAFRKIKNWERLMEDERHLSIDERYFSNLFLGSRVFFGKKKRPLWLRKLYSLTTPYSPCLFEEFHTTILGNYTWIDGSWDHPEVWFWKDGKLTNDRDGDREFIYLHFMNWKSNRWLPKFRGKRAAWQDLDKINYVSQDDIQRGWQIDRSGFHPLATSD